MLWSPVEQNRVFTPSPSQGLQELEVWLPSGTIDLLSPVDPSIETGMASSLVKVLALWSLRYVAPVEIMDPSNGCRNSSMQRGEVQKSTQRSPAMVCLVMHTI
jgi:hypothetical protein